MFYTDSVSRFKCKLIKMKFKIQFFSHSCHISSRTRQVEYQGYPPG